LVYTALSRAAQAEATHSGGGIGGIPVFFNTIGENPQQKRGRTCKTAAGTKKHPNVGYPVPLRRKKTA
jgi:hypothetical protein